MNAAFISRIDNSYARLPTDFHARQGAEPVAAPALIALNRPLAEQLCFDPDWLAGPDGLAMLAGNRIPAVFEPLAMAYAGHQFGHWVPQLGDGRALLLGEIKRADGERFDLQLKGSGRTPFSRGGDGRSSIGPVVREYLGSEAMAALGLPTTRSLAAVSTGEVVMREQPQPGGILCRVARSHVRIGTFEYFARRGQTEAVRTLADYVIQRHYPALQDRPDRYLALFAAVSERTAELVARWMLVGFIHGVMNTDNCSIVGETIDYGPFGFIDAFDPDTVYSYIDRRGRYAYQQQPSIAQWNLARLAECLLALIDDQPELALEAVQEQLNRFPEQFDGLFHAGLAAKLGLAPSAAATELALDLLGRMQRNQADMSLCFRGLGRLSASAPAADEPVASLFREPADFQAWAAGWREQLRAEGRQDAERQAAMQRVNPAFILRNHLAQRAADAAVERLDFGPMHELARVLARPFDDQPEQARLSLPPRPDERVAHTFCGT